MTESPAEFIVDIWTWDLRLGDAEIDRLAALLTEDEVARAERFVFDKHRNRFIAARGRLREILGVSVGRDPGDLAFFYGARGKPALEPGHGFPFFNLSHSEDLAVLGISAGGELGVDIEAVRPFKEGLPEEVFSAGEIAQLNVMPERERLAGFFRGWTRKEAVMKALGLGFALPLTDLDVAIGGEPEVLRLEGSPNARRDWSLRHLEPAAGFVGALACQTAGLRLTVRNANAHRP